jgi:hypothetical protein
MSSFKIKKNRQKKTEEMFTLDEIHRNTAITFNKRNKNLPLKKKKIEKLMQELEEIEKKISIECKTDIITIRAQLKTDIKKLENEIYDIENNISELEYYNKTENILMDYYDVIDQNVHSNMVDFVPVNVVVLDENINDLDKLNKLNKSNKIDRGKKKNIRKKKKKSDLYQNRDILSYLNINQNEQEDKKVTETNIDNSEIGNNLLKSIINVPQKQISKNRAEYLDQYKMLTDVKYIPESKRIYNPMKMCEKCEIEKTYFGGLGEYVCEECGEVEMIMTETEKQSYNEPIPDRPGYPYKRINHFSEWLSQFQAKESVDIPDEVYNEILSELLKSKFKDKKKLARPFFKRSFMRKILKKLGYQQYYEHTMHIISKLSNVPPPTISRETEDTFREMFKQIQEPFDRHCPKTRVNFLSYSYVLHKFCELLELDEFIKCFPLLKSRDKLRQQDKMWENMCDDLRWQFIPSI